MKFDKLVRECINQIPPYVPGKPIEEVQRELGLSTAIKMASNENPLGFSNEVRQAITAAMGQLPLYPDANQYYLKEALAKELGVTPEHLLIGNGSDEVNKILGETILKPQDEVIIPQPTFSQYEYITVLMGAKPVFVSGTNLGNDLQAMRSAVTSKTKMIFICNPNNPTGTIVTRDELVAFLRSIPEDIVVVVDEAYSDFATDPDYPDGIQLLQEGFKNVVVYRTFSKIHGLAGIRLGYAVADPGLIKQMLKVKEPFNVNLLAQVAGIAALNSKEHIMLSKELVKQSRAEFYRELDRLKLSYLPTEANFILIDCGRDSAEIYHYLLQNGIIVRATHSFGLPTCIRVTFGTVEQNQQFFKVFKEALEKLAG